MLSLILWICGGILVSLFFKNLQASIKQGSNKESSNSPSTDSYGLERTLAGNLLADRNRNTQDSYQEQRRSPWLDTSDPDRAGNWGPSFLPTPEGYATYIEYCQKQMDDPDCTLGQDRVWRNRQRCAINHFNSITGCIEGMQRFREESIANARRRNDKKVLREYGIID